MNAYEILGISPGATQKEIYNAYRKMALKYHPDKNLGNEEWANKKFIEVSEAYNALSKPSSTSKPKKNYDFSGKSSAEKFKMAFEMMAEMNEDLDRMEEDLNNAEENLKQEQERLWSEAILNMEELLSLSNVFSSDLDSSLWSPYGDWREKVRNSVDSSLDVFLGDMRIAINRVKWDKINANNANHYSGNKNNYDNNYSWNSQPPREKDDNERSNYSNKNFSPNSGGWSGEEKPFSTSGDRIAQLEAEIEYNRNWMLNTPHEDEKQKCQKIIARLEKELRKLKGSSNSNKNREETTNSNSGSSSNYGSSGNNNDNSSKDERDEKISGLEAEIEQLKKSKTLNPRKWQEKKRKLAEKEQELSDLKESNNDSDVYGDWYDEWDQEQLTNEFKKLKSENKTDELTKRVSQLEKVIQRLVKEIEELRAEVKELKGKNQKGNLSEYETYYLNRQESQLRNRQSKLEKLTNLFNNNNSSDFPIGWVVGGGTIIISLVLLAFLARRNKKNNKKELKWKKQKEFVK